MANTPSIPYRDPHTMPDNILDDPEFDAAESYKVSLQLGLEFITMYELEHPVYRTESDFIAVMQVWEKERFNWQRMNRDIRLLRPKRRLGRPKDLNSTLKTKKKFDCYIQVGLSAATVSQLSALQGDLPLDECIRQLLAHALAKPV